jgi:hypothetical protein
VEEENLASLRGAASGVQASSGPAIHERFARRLKEADRSAISPSQTWMERAKAARINSTMRRSLSRSLCIVFTEKEKTRSFRDYRHRGPINLMLLRMAYAIFVMD